ncbi:hypothetical protein WICPIJ_007816, partial [Wickerhamomyces pijperi]
MGKSKKKSSSSKKQSSWSRNPPSEVEEESEDEFIGKRRPRRLVTTNYAEPTSDFEENIEDDEIVNDTLDDTRIEEDENIGADEEEQQSVPARRGRSTRRSSRFNHDAGNGLEEEEEATATEDHTHDEKVDDDLEDYEEPVRSQRPARSTKVKKAKKTEEDDEDYSAAELSEEENEDIDIDSDESAEIKPRQKSFIVKDDDDDDEDYDFGQSRRKKRRRNNLNLDIDGTFGVPNDNDDPDQSLNGELLDELADLKDEDKHYKKSKLSRLRANTKKVDYSIPPPLGDSALFNGGDDYAPRTSGRRAGTAAGPIRRLYPTGGPFGGGDVVSIFHNLSNSNNVTSNQLTGGVDSDSSDDEILPVGGVSNRRNSSVAAPFNSNSNKSKKSANADTDPLGVDMNIDFS